MSNSFKVPLLGIVQIGGQWTADQRRLDGLPWCGCLMDQGQDSGYLDYSITSNEDQNMDQVVFTLRQVYANLINN